MPLADLLKRAAVRVVPGPALAALRRVHYARRLRSPDLADEPDLVVVRALVDDGDVAIDLGANVGLYTSVLSRWVGPRGVVHAVEPIPETHRTLRYVTLRLGLENVRLHECAVADREGRARMELPRMARGEGHYFARLVDGRTFDDAEQFDVRVATLDALTEAVRPRVAFVKCDVEGHELGVVRGAAALLAAAAPAWLIEVAGDPDDEAGAAASLFAELTRRGYDAWWYDGLRLRRRARGDRSVNYFFLTDAHLARVRERAPALAPVA